MGSRSASIGTDADRPRPPFADRPAPSTASAAPATPLRVTITLEGHGSAACALGERALVAMERAQAFGRLTGLPRKLPVGCRRGGCGICRARVIAGDFRRDAMSRAHVSAEDEAAGIVLSCAIYPSTDITLRLEPPSLGNKTGRMADPSRGGD